MKAEPPSLLTSEIGPDEIHFPLKGDKRDFIDAIKTDGRTMEDEHVYFDKFGGVENQALKLGGGMQGMISSEPFSSAYSVYVRLSDGRLIKQETLNNQASSCIGP